VEKEEKGVGMGVEREAVARGGLASVRDDRDREEGVDREDFSTLLSSMERDSDLSML
jgi:hypothetical protein